ncbi:MAG: APC family permease [Chloroflexota bacterium]
MSAQTAAGSTVAETNLRPGALRLPSIFMQSLTMVAPGIAALFYTPVVVGQTGLAAPLAYPIAFIIVLLTAIVLAQLARAVPGAGGYYNYVSRGINPSAGFLVSWLNIIFAPLVLGAVTVFGGWVLASSLEWSGPLRDWFPIIFGVVIVSIVAIIQYLGVQLSGKTLIITGGIELIVVSLLGLWGLANPGPGGLNFEPFNPGNASSTAGLFIAAVFAIQAFTGWEGAAPMAEESENPTTNVPRALIGSVILFGIFIVIVQWGVMVGWGTDRFAEIPKSPELPGIALAKQFWGGAWGILLIMLISSVIAVSIACANVGTRMYYRMGADGAFPRWFGKVHPERKTPVNAIVAQWVLALATIVIFCLVAALFTPVPEGQTSVPLDTIYQNQYYIDGYLIGYVVLIIYTMGNIAAYMLYRRERKAEFSWILHGLFPILSTFGMLVVLLFSLNFFGPNLEFQPDKWTLPPAPFNIPVVFVGVWFIIGLILVAYLRSSGHTDWMQAAADGASERPATSEELEALKGEW